MNLFPIGLIAARRGELERAREVAEEGCRLAELHGALLPGLIATTGLVELWSGDAAAAASRFAAAEQTAAEAEFAEPAMYSWRADCVEALLELGRIDEAEGILDGWEADARRLGRGWVLADATRSRGLVAAARGDVEEALSLLAEAVAVTRRSAIPSGGRGRSLLSAPPAGGQSRSAPPARRSRRRSPASTSSVLWVGPRRPVPSWGRSAAARRRRA